MIIIAACIPVLRSSSLLLFRKIKNSATRSKSSDIYHRDVELSAAVGRRSTPVTAPKGMSSERGSDDYIDDCECSHPVAPNRIKRAISTDISYSDLVDQRYFIA